MFAQMPADLVHKRYFSLPLRSPGNNSLIERDSGESGKSSLRLATFALGAGLGLSLLNVALESRAECSERGYTSIAHVCVFFGIYLEVHTCRR